MTISLTRRQKLAAIAKAHDAWVDKNLAAVSPDFEPAAHPKKGSDYNQHNVDVDASGEAEDELAAMVEEIFGAPMTAAGDPDWDESEHPRGPDGKFIEDGDFVSKIKILENKIGGTSLAKSVAYLKGEDYKAQSLQQELDSLNKELEELKKNKLSAPSKPAIPTPKLSPSPKKDVGGKPITAWTKTIYSGNYENGQIVAVKESAFDAHERITWDAEAKKFVWQKENALGGWTSGVYLTKKDAYNQFKGEKKSWTTPAPGATVTGDAPPPLAEWFPPKEVQSPQFSILPRGERGKSGDGYFAGNFWGKYGAAGLMMRHKGEDGKYRFLLVQANMADNPNTYGKWQLPGGALEELETPEQGAAREVHEELGFSQEFLHQMHQRETHKVTFDVPNFGEWSYSNITVDVPTPEKMAWDRNELGGAKWVTEAEMKEMSKNGEIIAPLQAGLSSILSKFDNAYTEKKKAPQSAPVATPAVEKLEMPSTPDVPAISQTSSTGTTTWQKHKFSQALAYKHSYGNREIVAIANINGIPNRILWESGKFRYYAHHYDKGWQYSGTWNTKKDAIAALKDAELYRPPAGTMANANNDYISWDMLTQGDSVINVAEDTDPDVFTSLIDNVPISAPAPASTPSGSTITLGDFSSDGKPYYGYKTSFKASNSKGDHIGALHEKKDGTWFISAVGFLKPFLWSDQASTKEDAVKALEAADNTYQETLANAPAPAPKPKKIAKLTVDQIEKQNGAIPKTLKSVQKAKFFKTFRNKSPAGIISPSEMSAQKVFTALVHAVNEHNETQSPKLNYLQGLNALDQSYGTHQKDAIVAWLKTSSGKSIASGILSGGSVSPGVKPGVDTNPTNMDVPRTAQAGDVTITAVRVNSSYGTVTSPYALGTPKKVPPYQFKTFGLSDAIEMHEKMDKERPLTSVQRHAVEDYTAGASPYNKPLRGDGDEVSWNAQKIANLQSAMRPVPDSFIVTRMTNGLGAVLNMGTSETDIKKLEGAVIQDPSFLSTSVAGGSFGYKSFQLVISVPQGTPAVWAHHFSSFESEREVLLAAGLHYRIDSIGPSNSGGRKVFLTVVPEVKK